MMRYIFTEIPSLLFEPIAVGAILGIFTSFFVCRKSHGFFYWIISFSVFFLLLWRISVHTIMLSTRYSAILLYPAIIFTAWFCFFLRDAARQQISHFSGLNEQRAKRICAILPFLFIAGLTIASLCKTLHYNPYGNHTIKLCEKLSREIEGRNFYLFTHVEPYRIAYYTGLDRQKVQLLGGSDAEASVNDLLKTKILSFRNLFDPLYFVSYQKKEMPELDREVLGIPLEAGKWECIHREYTSRRKNKEIVLYRFTPAQPNIEVWEKEIPETSSRNLCVNGDFEKFITGRNLEQRIAYYRTHGASDFYLTPGRLFPTSWWLGVPTAANGKKIPEMALTDKHPIKGKYSMEINSTDSRFSGINCARIRKQDGQYSGYFRAETDSYINVYTCCPNTDEGKTTCLERFLFQLKAGKTYRFKIPARQTDIPEKEQSTFLIVSCSGHILLDNVEFISNQITTKTEVKQ